MQVIVRLVLIVKILFVAVISSHAQTPIPAAPSIGATSYQIMDYNSGKIIAEKNPNERLPPASITKLMTAYVTFKKLQELAISLEDMVPVSEHAYQAEGSRMFIEINSKVKLEDLVQGMIVQSGNDASIAIAEYIGGTEEAFATLMNYHSNALGMVDSQFMNSTGLPSDDHYSTAHDIAILARAIIFEFPQYYRWYSQKEFTYNDIRQHNRNSLLWTDDSVDGVKTGSTDAAGYCLVASAKRGDMRLISVVMGTSSIRERADASQSLLNYAFNFFKTHRLYQAGEAIVTRKVWKADSESISVGLAEDLYVTIPKGQYDALKASMDLRQPLTAPIRVNTPLGEVTITLQNEIVVHVPLIALNDVGEGSIFRRLSDSVMLWFE